nr:integrase, catalytic region, zinc finger, CCHC-type, peptidase aspartic, catalytic [Tanacetum cinerariifolium]
MSNTSDDIQAIRSNTRPHMLDRTDYKSWVQRFRMYCKGKENGVYILQSIDEGTYQMETTRDALGTADDGGVTLGIDRPRTYNDLNEHEKKRFDDDIQATNIDGRVVIQNVQGRQNQNQRNFARGTGAAGNVSSLQQAGPSDASILSEVLNLEKAINHHEIPNEVQQTNVLDSDSVDMGNSNVIRYEQLLKHNEESVVPSGASYV